MPADVERVEEKELRKQNLPPEISALIRAKKPKGKYRAETVTVDGIRFASKLEARCYQHLRLRQLAGEVSYFLRQVPIHLPGEVRYVVDFLVVESGGRIRYIDAKGVETAMFRTKKKLVEAVYPIQIELWRGEAVRP